MTRSKFNVRTDKSGKVPESGVLRACLDLLAAEKIWHCRMNTGAVRDGKRFFRFGRRGMADILATPIQGCELEVLWIECKSDSGKQTEDQKEFQAEVSKHGHSYLLARSPDDVKKWLGMELI